MPLPRAILDAPTVTDRLDSTVDLERIEELRAIERNWERVKKLVAERDKGRCRLCGKRCSYGAKSLSERGDPHHIVFQSAGGEDSTANVLLLCRACHDLCHKVRRFWLSGNADDKDPMGKGVVKVERQGESGFVVVGFI